MLTWLPTSVRAGASAVGALACLAVFVAPADAAFSGRDGRILWVDGEYSDTAASSGDFFYVNQLPARGEASRADGEMQCFDSPEPDLAGGERLCPFFRPTFSPDGRTIAVGVERSLNEEENGAPRRTNLALEKANTRFGAGRSADIHGGARVPHNHLGSASGGGLRRS